MIKFIIKLSISILIIFAFIFIKNSDNQNIKNIYDTVQKNLFENRIDLDKLYVYFSDKLNPSVAASSISTQIPYTGNQED